MSASSPPPTSATLSPLIRVVVTCSTMLATVLQGVDATIANVALPYMQGSMSVSQEQIDWVLTSYIVTAAIMTTPTSFLVARFGRTRLFIGIVVGFTLASVLCGMAQTLGEVVCFRILQGMCGASLVPLSQVVLMDIYPPEKRGSAMSIWTMGVMIGPILGPTLGGFLTAHYSWRAVFYVNVPFGILAATGLLFCPPELSPRRSFRLDWVGFIGLSMAIGMFQTVLDRGETLDWFSSKEIIIETFLAGIGFYIFIVQFLFAPKPFLSPQLFKDLNFLIGMVLIFVVGATVYATLALLAPYIQDLMNYPVSTAGLVLAPRGFGSMLAAFFCGRLLTRGLSPRIMVAAGFVFAAYSEYRMVYWTPDISVADFISTGFIQGMGVIMITVPIATIAFLTLPIELRTEATSVFSLLRNLGSAIGISVTSALLEVSTQVNHADISSAVTPFNRALASGAPLQYWNPLRPEGVAALDSVINRQGIIIAYSNDFKLLFLLTALTLPLVLLIRTPAKQA